ncbi:MAG: cation:proton antiporter, partial [Yaniella sp.]|nr:cation:proton antiporter [Yaniella sp.]
MLLTAILLTLIAAVLAAPLSHWLGKYAGWLLWIPLAGAAWALIQAFAGSGGEVIEYYPWIPDFFNVGFHLRLNGLSLVFGLLVLVIGAGVLFYSARYLDRTKITSFYLSMSAFALAMLVLVLANDLMVLYVAWEATTLASFFLIARSGSHARKPAVRTLLVTVAGGLGLLAAVSVMIASTGTTVITEILRSDIWDDSSTVTWLILTLVLAAFTKSAQFPFQSWLPDSMVAISPVSAYLHAAAMVKAGIYLLLLFSAVLAGNTLWLVLLVSSGLITALLGAVAALRRYDLKELLAYSTMSQLGYLVALIGIGTPTALTAAILHTIAHALFKSALFLAVGVIDHEAGTRDMRMLTVRKMAMPATLTIVILGSASMAGIPPLLGFVSKEHLFQAFLGAELPGVLPWVLTGLAVLTAIGTFAYSGRFVLGAMGSYRSPRNWINTPRGLAANRQTVYEAAPSFWAYPAVNASLSLILGVFPFFLADLVSDSATAAVGAHQEVELALWHGINPAFMLSLLVIVVGAIMVWQLPRLEAFLVPRPLVYSGLGAVEKLRQTTIEFGAVVSSWTSGLSPGRHLVWPAALLAGLALTGWFAIDELPAQQENLTRWTDWLLVAVVAVGVIATIRARTRVAAIVVLGTVGFSVTLWFFALGSVDVALT